MLWIVENHCTHCQIGSSTLEGRTVELALLMHGPVTVACVAFCYLQMIRDVLKYIDAPNLSLEQLISSYHRSKLEQMLIRSLFSLRITPFLFDFGLVH